MIERLFRKTFSDERLIGTFHLDLWTLSGSIGISLLDYAATYLMYFFSWKAVPENVAIWYSFAI